MTPGAPKNSFVAIGCSLGGFRAIGVILGALPRDFVPPIALVQHRAAQGTEDYCAALQRSTALRVIEAEDKQRPIGGHVHVAPAGYHLLLDDGAFALSVDDPVHFARPSIDVLFESVAEERGPDAIAVVLSGASRDGTEGALKICAAGGRVVIQDPEDAECKIMPTSTLAAMLGTPSARVVLPLDQIAPWLLQHAKVR